MWLLKAGIGACLAALGCAGLAVWYVAANPLPKKAEAAPSSPAQEELLVRSSTA
jgi:hypothetical protein